MWKGAAPALGNGSATSASKGLDLPPKVVTVDAHVQPADVFLAALLGAVGRLGEQDQPGAGVPGGHAFYPVLVSVVVCRSA